MKSGIFRRLFLTNAGLVLIALALLGIAVTVFVEWYSFEQKQRELMVQGQEVSRLTSSYLEGRLDRDSLALAIDSIGSSTGSRIMVLKARHDAVGALQEQLGKDGEEKDLAALYEKVLAGRSCAVRRHYASQIDLEVTMVGLPVKSRGQVQAVVFLYAPLSEIRETLRGFYYIIWGCAGMAMVLAAAMAYMMSRRLSRPLLHMADGARRLARGENIPDYEIQGDDELADLANAMNYMQREIARTEEIRQELITNVSHELRTPLTTVSGFVRAILDGVVPGDEEHRYLELADSELQRLIRLVRDLLDLSRLKAGKVRMDFRATDLAAAAQKALDVMELAALEAGVSLNWEHFSDPVVLGDEDRIIQVVINLLQNALDYTRPGGRVSLKVSTSDGEALLEVQDNGAGIPAEDLPRIFDRFHRAEGSKKAGTGVGLAIVREIVARHGGMVDVMSAVGKGTNIAVRLPLFTNGSHSGQGLETHWS